VNYRVRQVWVQRPVSSLRTGRGAAVLLRIDRWGESSTRASFKPTIAAAIEGGKGRLVVLSCPLETDEVRSRKDRPLLNDGERFFFNALKWACHVDVRRGMD
jgi:hypothetical protein